MPEAAGVDSLVNAHASGSKGQPARTLDVGCGINKYSGAIGIDRNPRSRADVLCDLDRFPYPFRGGRVFLVTPHYTDFSSFCDPTHRWHLNSFSFRYFGPDHGGFGYYSAARFREVSVHVRLLALWRWLGFEFLVNRFKRFRRFWEYYLCYVIRGKVMEFEFEAIK
jgi:hypothetical protein